MDKQAAIGIVSIRDTSVDNKTSQWLLHNLIREAISHWDSGHSFTPKAYLASYRGTQDSDRNPENYPSRLAESRVPNKAPTQLTIIAVMQ